jgi:uncharacterized protein (TIGR03435 family)
MEWLVWAGMFGMGALGFGQAKATGVAPSSTQADKRDYRFEVASIHPADPSGIGPLPQPSPGRFNSGNQTIPGLAMKAFDLKANYQIEYKPWMQSKHFTVVATFPEGATQADLPIMIQHLLEDRFGLVFHRETRHLSGYELVVAKNGPKLTKSAPPNPDEAASTGPSVVVKNGVPQFAANASGTLFWAKGATVRGHNKTMEYLASTLARQLHQPVVEATGLSGQYEFTVTYMPDELLAANAAGPPKTLDDGSASLPLPDALQSQLGLKLQAVKDVPTDVVVLDDAKKEPTEN